MLQVQGCYGLQYTRKDSAAVLNSSSGLETPEKKSQAAANKHALAERYRRKRINTHLDTLRKLFPNLPKSDKPRVLMETVRYLKELRKKVDDHVEMNDDDQEGCCIGGKRSTCSLMFLPGEKDEVSVSCYSEEGGGGDHGIDQGKLLMVKATICCEDRPRLNADLTEAVKSVKGRVVKAEMGTIGGRTKAVLVVQWCKQTLQGGGGGGGCGEEEVGSLRKALNAVVENRALTPSSLLGPQAAYFKLD